MRRSALALAATLLGFTATGARADGWSAASAPVYRAPAVADWSGFYAGGQLGAGWSNSDWDQINANYFNTIGPVLLGTETSINDTGFIGGVYGGYNGQIGPWVIGVEVDITSVSDAVSKRMTSPFFATDSYKSQLDWLGSITGRFGYAWERWLLYGRGGWAGGEVRMRLNDPVLGIEAAKDTWSNGWTLGAGVEYKVQDCFSLGLAYDYAALDLNAEPLSCPLCGTGPGFGSPIIDSDLRLQSLMVRATYYIMQD
jgi:outer membrane immunogenic protein